MKISKISIFPNYRKLWAIKLAKTVSLYLKRYGFTPGNKNADATICIGGDGTIFFANHRSRLQGAVLGIGSKTSVVCQLRKNNWKKYLASALKNGKIEKRVRLDAKIKRKSFQSINDIVLHTHDYRVIRIFFHITKKKYVFDGDGLIISTPTGSTGYAYSAGGTILKRDISKIQIVPICPYKRSIKPMLLELDSIIIYADRSSDLIIDGIYIMRLKPKQKIRIKQAKGILFLDD